MAKRWLPLVLVGLGVSLVLTAASVWWGALANDDPIYLEPQGSMRAQLAQAWIDTGSPSLELAERETIPADVQIALVPRDASVVDWAVVPKDFAYPVMLNTVVTPLGPNALAAITPLAAMLAAAAAAWILYLLTSAPTTAASGFLALSTSVVWWSSSYGGVSYALLGVSSGLLAVGVMITASRAATRTQRLIRYGLAGLLVGVAAGFHYTSAPWWGVVLLVGCIGATSDIRELMLRCGAAGVGLSIGFAPVLIFNHTVYGSVSATGYSEFATVLDAIGWNAPALGFSSTAFGSNLRTYLLRPEVIPVVLLAAMSLPALRSVGIRVRAVHVGLLLLGYGILVSVTGSATLWGTNVFRTNASFLRYSAPVFALLVVLAMLTLHRAGETNRRFVLAPVAFALAFAAVNAVTVVQSRDGLDDTRALVELTRADRTLMRESIPADAVVITRRGDKALFGERTTLVAAYLRTFTKAEDTNVHLYDTFPDMDRVASVVERLQPRPVVILNDSGWVTPIQLSRLEVLLGDVGLCIASTDPLIISVEQCGETNDSA